MYLMFYYGDNGERIYTLKVGTLSDVAGLDEEKSLGGRTDGFFFFFFVLSDRNKRQTERRRIVHTRHGSRQMTSTRRSG